MPSSEMTEMGFQFEWIESWCGESQIIDCLPLIGYDQKSSVGIGFDRHFSGAIFPVRRAEFHETSGYGGSHWISNYTRQASYVLYASQNDRFNPCSCDRRVK